MLRWFGSGSRRGSLPLTPDRAMKVSKVDEEYRFIKGLTCECGSTGMLKVVGQALMVYGRRFMDELTAMCQNCGATYKFYFDISEVQTPFGKISEGFTEEFLRIFDQKRREDAGEDEF